MRWLKILGLDWRRYLSRWTQSTALVYGVPVIIVAIALLYGYVQLIQYQRDTARRATAQAVTDRTRAEVQARQLQDVLDQLGALQDERAAGEAASRDARARLGVATDATLDLPVPDHVLDLVRGLPHSTPVPTEDP